MKYLPLLFILTACSTPMTMLQGPKGDIVKCGGSMAGSAAGGMIGYHIEKSHDEECVKAYQEHGYKKL